MKEWNQFKITLFLIAGLIVGTGWMYSRVEWLGNRMETKLHEADQGFVNDNQGNRYRLYRMQTFGIGGDLMAVYRDENMLPEKK